MTFWCSSASSDWAETSVGGANGSHSGSSKITQSVRALVLQWLGQRVRCSGQVSAVSTQDARIDLGATRPAGAEGASSGQFRTKAPPVIATGFDCTGLSPDRRSIW